MNATKRIPDEIFEELCGFTENGKLETNISQKNFDKKYAWDKINRFRLRNAGEAFLFKVNKKLINFLKKENIVSFLNTELFESEEAKAEITKQKEKKEKKKKSNFKLLRSLWRHRKALSNLKRTFQRLKNIRNRIRRITRFIVKRIIKPGFKKLRKRIKELKSSFRTVRRLFRIVYRKIGKELRTIVRRIFRCFRIMIRRASPWIARAGKKAAGLIPRLINLITRGFSIVFHTGRAALEFAGKKLGPVGRFLKDKLQKFLSFLRIELRKLAKKVKPLFRMLRNIALKVIVPIRKIAKKLGVALGKGFKKAFTKAIIKKVGKGVLKTVGKRAAGWAAAFAVNSVPVIGQIASAILIIANIGLMIWDAYEWYTFGKYVIEALDFLTNLPGEMQKIIGKMQGLSSDEKLKRMGQQKNKTFFDMRDIDGMLYELGKLEAIAKGDRNAETNHILMHQTIKFLESSEKAYENIGPLYNELVPLGLIKSIRVNDISEKNIKNKQALVDNIRKNFGHSWYYPKPTRGENPLTSPFTSEFFRDAFTSLQLELLLGGRNKEYKLNLMEIWSRIIGSICSNILTLGRYFKVVTFENIFNEGKELTSKYSAPPIKHSGRNVMPTEHFYNHRDKTVKPPDIPWKIGVKHVFKGANRLDIQTIYSIWDKLSEIGEHFYPYEKSKNEELNLQSEKSEKLTDIERLLIAH